MLKYRFGVRSLFSRVFIRLEKYVFESIKSFLFLQAFTSCNVVFGAEVKGHDEEEKTS